LSRAALERLPALGIQAEFSVSYTTRAPRPAEKQGRHYHFVDEAEFTAMVARNEFLEHAQVFGRWYGTGRARTMELLAQGRDIVLDIDWQGARQIAADAASGIGPEVVSIYVLPPSLAELESRLRARAQDDEATVRARMAEAQAEIQHFDEYDYLIINDDFERATNELIALFVARRQRLQVQQSLHQALLQELLTGTPAVRD